MLAEARDPRTDPRRGDILRRCRRAIKPGHNTYTTCVTRTVLYVEYGNSRTIMATRIQVRDGKTERRRPSLKQFRQWAAKAEVIQRAD